jgi:predicted metalloprotease with PDZ domain
MVENHQTARFHPPVRYTVRFTDRRTHYLSVEARLPVEGRAEVEIFMPVWTPGSYLVREYARNIEAISAVDTAGNALSFSKSSKNRWIVQAGGTAEIQFTYRLYCREMSVRTNWVEDSFALLNGAPTFVALTGELARPYELLLDLPSEWTTAITGLPEISGDPPHRYLAEDYDALVDSPIFCGNPAVYKFEVDGIPHLLANEGEQGVWDGPRSAADAQKLVRRHRELWGSLPYRKYVFLNLLTEAGGGLEHRNSACLMTSRWATRARKSYLAWLNLVSHEFFHVWNVKLLRPVELGPFNYESENYTRSLWIAEGITEYYGPLTVRRAGLSSPDEYLGALSDKIQSVQSTPGRQAQSLEQASWDAWIKLYRPDENSANSTISYYTKGALIGWLLDARIRHSTEGTKSLDDLLRAAFARFSGERGFTPEEFKALACEVGGQPLHDFFRETVESTEELDYSQALEWFGLRFKDSGAQEPGGVIGCDTRIDHGRLIVKRVPRATPAFEAGIAVDDEIIAIDDFRVRPDHFAQRLESYRPGDKVSILLARRDALMRIDLILGDKPKNWALEIRPDATGEQKQNFGNWLGL